MTKTTKSWVKPEVTTLDVDQTLFGIIKKPNENIYSLFLGTNPPAGS